MPSIEDAHAALLKNARLQFDFSDAPTQPAPPHPESWFSSFHWGGSDLGWVVVVVAATLALLVLWRAFRQRQPDAAAEPPSPEVVISVAAARASLAAADGLAAAGRFAEAAHTLLACGVDEIGRRYPALLHPATTSRDIVERGGLPDALHRAFGLIAATVEKGIFGNRPVTAADYAACRDSFATSALAGSV